MFHNRSLNKKINRLHERCLRIIYNDKNSNFEELLAKDNSVPIHHNNIHTLAIEMYKVANGMSPEIMSDIFKLRENTHYLHRICDPKFGNKYPSKLKIFIPLLVLEKKLENGNMRIAPVEFHTQFRLYLKSIRKYLLVKTRIMYRPVN